MRSLCTEWVHGATQKRLVGVDTGGGWRRLGPKSGYMVEAVQNVPVAGGR